MKDEAPPGFPPRTLTAMRAVSVVTLLDGDSSQDRLVRVLDALFHGLWAEHRPVQELTVLEDVLRSVLGDSEAKESKPPEHIVLICGLGGFSYARTLVDPLR